MAVLIACAAVQAPKAAHGAFPLELSDVRGATVRLAAPPRRVVSLAPNLTEIVFLLGEGKKLAGVTRYCNFPPEAKRLPRVGGIADPDLERIAALAPDLILCTTDGNPRDKVEALEAIGFHVFCIAPQDIAAVFADIERIGTLLGVPDRARRETDRLRARQARASQLRTPPVPRVLFAVSTSPVIAAGKGTFLDELIRRAGGKNAAASYVGRYPRLSTEDLIAAAPDVIVVASMVGVERFAPEVTRWTEVPAFRDGAIFSLDGDLVTRPGPRMIAALEQLSGVLSDWRTRHGRAPAGAAGKAR